MSNLRVYEVYANFIRPFKWTFSLYSKYSEHTKLFKQKSCMCIIRRLYRIYLVQDQAHGFYDKKSINIFRIEIQQFFSALMHKIVIYMPSSCVLLLNLCVIYTSRYIKLKCNKWCFYANTTVWFKHFYCQTWRCPFTLSWLYKIRSKIFHIVNWMINWLILLMVHRRNTHNI